MKNLHKIGLMLAIVLSFSQCTDEETPVNEQSPRLIEYFAFESFDPVKVGEINNEEGIIEITIPFETENYVLSPTIEISEGATIEPAIGTEQDFSSFVVYTVTATDGAKKLYTVLTSEANSNDASLRNIRMPDLFRNGTIDEENKTVGFEVGFGTDLSEVVLNFEAREEDATLSIESGEAYDLTNDLELAITAPDEETTATYTIQVTELPQETGIRGVWLTNVDSEVLSSQAGIEGAVAQCKKLNFNTIFVVTYNRATTTYPSQVMEDLTGQRIASTYEGRDPLRELIDAAHAEDIKVMAWFEYGFAAFNGSPGPILEAKPEWGAINSSGEQVVKNGFFWLNSLLPEVQEFMTDLVLEVVTKYPDIDGVQGDDRLPAMPSEGGYDDYTKDKYAAEHGGAAPPNDRLEGNWLQWRADILNAYGQQLYNDVKAINPNCIVAMSPSPLDFGFREYLQDYTKWVQGGYADIVSPQLYRRDNQGISVYRGLLQDQLGRVGPENINKFYPGLLSFLGGYVPNDDFLAGMILENRKNGVTGEVQFFYNSLLASEKVFMAMYPGPAIYPDL